MGKKVRTKKACEILGCCPDTLRRWTEEGKLTAYRASEKGNRRWDEDELRAYLGEIKPDQTNTASKGNRVAVYCRVSTSDQKSHGDLDRQKLRLLEYCAEKKYAVEWNCGSPWSRSIRGISGAECPWWTCIPM